MAQAFASEHLPCPVSVEVGECVRYYGLIKRAKPEGFVIRISQDRLADPWGGCETLVHEVVHGIGGLCGRHDYVGDRRHAIGRMVYEAWHGAEPLIPSWLKQLTPYRQQLFYAWYVWMETETTVAATLWLMEINRGRIAARLPPLEDEMIIPDDEEVNDVSS